MYFKNSETITKNYRNAESLCVALVGLGALGSEFARLLGILGVSEVILIDNDTVESSNMAQSIFFREEGSVGRTKAEVIAGKGLIYFPKTRWTPLACEIADVGLGKLTNCSLVFSATDSSLSRVETAYAARRLGIPMVDAGLCGSARWRGQAAWFAACAEGACYFCQLGENRRAEMLAFAHSTALRCQWAAENADMPSTPTMSSIVAGMAIDLAFRYGLFANERNSFAWDIRLETEPRLERHSLKRSSTCPFHNFPGREHLISLPYYMPFRESLPAARADAVELDWPVAVSAVCRCCGHTWCPLRRLAWVRRHGRCPKCGEDRVSRVQTISRVTAEDKFGECSPASLSCPEDHLYTPLRRHREEKL